jgi:hypothetical protein
MSVEGSVEGRGKRNVIQQEQTEGTEKFVWQTRFSLLPPVQYDPRYSTPDRRAGFDKWSLCSWRPVTTRQNLLVHINDSILAAKLSDAKEFSKRGSFHVATARRIRIVGRSAVMGVCQFCVECSEARRGSGLDDHAGNGL